MPYYINHNILDLVNNFRGTMDSAITYIVGCYPNAYNIPNFKYYYLISENVRMDLNYLLSVNIEYDMFNFVGVHRNIRSSVEAYYDLFNLTMDGIYLYLLKLNSNNCECTDKELDILRNNPKYSEYVEQLSKRNHLTIKQKSVIAQKNMLEPKRYTNLKTISKESNEYIHSDIFTEPKTLEAKVSDFTKLIDTDCQLLADSLDLIYRYCYKYNIAINGLLNPYEQLNGLRENIGKTGCFVEYRIM